MPNSFQEKKEALFAQLSGLAEVEILGVVSARGAGGARVTGDLWSLTFSFSAWKFLHGILNERELTVRKDVSKEELRLLMDRIVPYRTVCLKARVGEENVFGIPQALLVEIIDENASEVELNAFARRLQEPILFDDPMFGTFKLNRRLNWFEAAATWKGLPVSLTIPANEVETSLAVARNLWQAQDEWQRRVTDYAVSKLLAFKNSSWLGENEIELTAEEFKKRMTLESISIRGNGDFEFWHNDGDIFWGHSILVSGHLIDGPNHADIPG